MWQPNNFQWWALLVVALLIVFVWPPRDGKSLAVTFVNWSVDPWDELPVLPGPLALGLGDDPEAVRIHDEQTQYYDYLYMRGGWTRRRLELKVLEDPLDPDTERQILTGLGVVVAFLVWKLGAKPAPKSSGEPGSTG